MKLLRICCLVVTLAGLALGIPDKEKQGHITQDSVELDLDTGTISFNDEPVSLKQLSEKLQESYSVSLRAVYFSGKQTLVPSGHLRSVLEKLDEAGIDPKLVRLNLSLPLKMKRNQYHHIELERDGKVLLNGTEQVITDLFQKKFKGNPVAIDPKSKSMKIDYRQLLTVFRSIGDNVEIAGLGFVDSERVKVEALIYRQKPDGTRDVLSAPQLTAMVGCSSAIRVVENASGRKNYPSGTDNFNQEDLANLGIRFSAKPQIIGDYIRVSGVAILTKSMDMGEVLFMDRDTPLFSYSVMKTVIPFSVLFPSGTETVEFPVADIDGKKAMCQLSVCVVGERGMSRADRERARVSPNAN